jgi:tetratricopeptide (TPR) repeat protein
MNELYGKSYLLQLQGYIHLQRGDLAGAAAIYSHIVDLLAGSEIKDVFLFFLPYQAEIALLMGDQEGALSILEESLLLADEATAPQAEAVTRRVLGQLLATQGDFAGAAAAFERAIALTTELGSRLTLGRVYYHRALMHELQGRSDLAVQDGIEAQTIFTTCEAARDLNLAMVLLARFQ